jgi:hypothetical protein
MEPGKGGTADDLTSWDFLSTDHFRLPQRATSKANSAMLACSFHIFRKYRNEPNTVVRHTP